MRKNLIKVIQEREQLVQRFIEAADDIEASEGLNKILSDIYPDTAHFVFELLQNAEDANATKVKFELYKDYLSFAHNGTRAFDEKDIKSICNIGGSNKSENKIGKFGIGFKSVFSYTDTPKIYSDDISFEINNLIVPSLIDELSVDDGYSTLFVFPFNKKEKPSARAYDEIIRLFNELGDSTLLFLSNISSIEWLVDKGQLNTITRKKEGKFTEITNTGKDSTSWLVFNEVYKISQKDYSISIAFSYDKTEKKIKPTSGDVSIFFPAKKETSNLRFHINAPFSTTVARDSIIDSDENDELILEIAKLCSQSIHEIKKLGLLTMEFIGVLPNDDDNLSKFYDTVLQQLKEEFESDESELIPLENGSFSSLNNCVFCSRLVKDTFTDEVDITFIFKDEDIKGFAKNPLKNSPSDKFLSALTGLNKFKDEEINSFFYSICTYNYGEGSIDDESINDYREDEDYADELEVGLKRRAWLESKSNNWLQSLYAALFQIDQNEGHYALYEELNILIKISDGSFNYKGEKCFFGDTYVTNSTEFSIVEHETYLSGKNKAKQKRAKSFLEELGVKEVDEATRLDIIFSEYEFDSEKIHLIEIDRLVALYSEVGRLPDEQSYKDREFISTASNSLVSASEIAIDEPFENTGMRHVSDIVNLNQLNPIYKKLHDLPKFIELLMALGANKTLQIIRTDISDNKERSYLVKAEGEKWTSTGRNQDWLITNLDVILSTDDNKFEISKLVWNTINGTNPSHLTAIYRVNAQYNPHTAKSQLICSLIDHQWIPDKEKNYYTPMDISKDMLHDDFISENRNGWLDEVDFGKNIYQQKEEYQKDIAVLAKYCIPPELGEQLKKAGLSKEDFIEAIERHQSKKLKEITKVHQGTGETEEEASPRGESGHITDIKKHKKNVEKGNKGVDTGKHQGERNVTVQNQKQLEETKEYLYQQYDGHCQLCGDTFMLNNNKNYWEHYSFNRGKKGDQLDSDVNRKGNTLCLCPKHHAINTNKIHKYIWRDNMPESEELTIKIIKDLFDYHEDVGNIDRKNTNDSFYNAPEDSVFARDVYMLPVKIFKKVFYLKFTEDHMIEFIEVWNKN